MPSHRGHWLKRCVECGRKYKPRNPEPHERNKVPVDRRGNVIPLCSLIVCSGPKHLREKVMIENMEKALMGSTERAPLSVFAEEAANMLKTPYNSSIPTRRAWRRK